MKKKKKAIDIIIIITVIGLALYFVLNYSGAKKIKIDYPITYDISNQTSFACESLMDTGIIGSPDKHLIGGIEGEVQKGTDKLAVTIKDEKTLSFITKTAVEVGITEGDPFIILKNNKKELVAIHFDEIFSSLNTFSLNKKNGLAVWSKTKPEFIGYESPSGDIIYLICR